MSVTLNTKIGYLSVSGKVINATDRAGFPTLWVEIENEYFVDLCARVGECIQNWGSRCGIRFWQSTVPFDRDDAIMSIADAETLDGSISLDYDKQIITYSEYTQDVNYDTSFYIGGHNLFNVIKTDMYILIDFTFKLATFDDIDVAEDSTQDSSGSDVQEEDVSYQFVPYIDTSVVASTPTLIKFPSTTTTAVANWVEVTTSTPTLTVNGEPDNEIVSGLF